MRDLTKKKLAGKVAIVTGGASGIGEATVRLFADHGARMIIIADIQDQLGQQVATSIGSHNCTYMHCDVTDEDQVKALVQSSIQNYGQLDIMFSNAGILSKSDQTILDLDFQQFDRLMAVNLRGMVACVKHAARAMVENRVRGSIVCTASVAASRGAKRRTDYCMSKHAVLGLVRSASKQLGVQAIRVNCVSPNGLATPMTCHAHEKGVEEVEEIYEAGRVLKGAALRAGHVADAVLFLASDESELITGHDLVVDGGFQAWLRYLKPSNSSLKQILGDRIKMQYEQWVSNVRLYEDHISHMKTDLESKEMAHLLETAKADMMVGLKQAQRGLSLQIEIRYLFWFNSLQAKQTWY